MTLISTKKQKFLYDFITATVYTSHTGDMDAEAAGMRAQISEMSGRGDREQYLLEFAYAFTFTANLEFNWPTDEDVPDDIKSIEQAWALHVDGHSAYDIWLFWNKNVPTWVSDKWVEAVIAGQTIWKPRDQVTPTAEAIKKDPN